MARNVKPRFRKLKSKYPATYEGLADTEGMPINKAYDKLKEDGIPKITNKKVLKQIADKFGDKHNVDVKITDDMAGLKDADAVATRDIIMEVNNEIRLHPILQYREEEYIRDVLEHELDHVKVNRRVQNNMYKRYNLKEVKETKPSISSIRR
jgi:hypothetical protein